MSVWYFPFISSIVFASNVHYANIFFHSIYLILYSSHFVLCACYWVFMYMFSEQCGSTKFVITIKSIFLNPNLYDRIHVVIIVIITLFIYSFRAKFFITTQCITLLMFITPRAFQSLYHRTNCIWIGFSSNPNFLPEKLDGGTHISKKVISEKKKKSYSEYSRKQAEKT